MTPLPKKKHTKGRTGRRRGNKSLALPTLVRCPSCKKFKRPHVVCPHCGYHHRSGKEK
ncbi:MAG: 50S ribosomal protein L32 [bacterium]|nr:50S ribosomal protein L32 [bacterium]